MTRIPSSEITPESVYRSRRRFMAGIGALALSVPALAACGNLFETPPASAPGQAPDAQAPGSAAPTGAATTTATTDELGDGLTSFEAITNYNNYYEFSTSKEAVAGLVGKLKTTPWTLTVGGLVNKPKTYGVEDLLAGFDQEERIYRLRCVEGWSMVIPWSGFSLAKLLAEAEPQSGATYVRFETLMDPEQMPGQRDNWLVWPYIEGLRLDEAMHPLTILSTGLYGKMLLPQNGAPLRLVVPWKYGFKSIKAIVKIDLVDKQPSSLWMNAAPNEYGFYANVNPEVSHPRWSQSTERRIGELKRRSTLPFNGYAEQVAPLYAGMDLKAQY